MRDALCCRSPADAWSILNLGSPQLRAPGRKPGAASHGASRGIQILGLLLAQRRGSRGPKSYGAGRGRPASSSRVQDKACLVWASCDEAGSLAPLLVLPGSRPWVAKAVPPPLPPPPLYDLLLASSPGYPAPLAAGRDHPRLDRSTKMCSSNPAAAADT